MINDWRSRTALLLGEKAMETLASARVAVLGLGGVGGAAAEALCRAGVGHLLLIDHDKVEETNLNRQIMATRDTLGIPKAMAAVKRLRSITADGDFTPIERFYLPEDCAFLYDWQPDYVVDAIDTITAKLHLVTECTARFIPFVTCLGTGNRLDPSQLRIGDLADTANGCGCGLARVMRRELRHRGFSHCRVLYSLEVPQKTVAGGENGRHAPGSAPFVPPAAGFLLASEAVRTLLDRAEKIR